MASNRRRPNRNAAKRRDVQTLARFVPLSIMLEIVNGLILCAMSMFAYSATAIRNTSHEPKEPRASSRACPLLPSLQLPISVHELNKPLANRVYHNNYACPRGREIPQNQRKYGSVALVGDVPSARDFIYILNILRHGVGS
jgi:hypothetical protein